MSARDDRQTRRTAEYKDARATMEFLAQLIGGLHGASSSGRFARLRSYLAEVDAGRAPTPIGLFLTVREALEFLDVIEAASKVAIRLSDSAMSREAHPDDDDDGRRG